MQIRVILLGREGGGEIKWNETAIDCGFSGHLAPQDGWHGLQPPGPGCPEPRPELPAFPLGGQATGPRGCTEVSCVMAQVGGCFAGDPGHLLPLRGASGSPGCEAPGGWTSVWSLCGASGLGWAAFGVCPGSRVQACRRRPAHQTPPPLQGLLGLFFCPKSRKIRR